MELSGREEYIIEKIGDGTVLDNLSPFDLEELVISYIQIKEGYYVLSNSIANKSTTIKIECEFRSRDKCNIKKAVVQVKGGTETEMDAKEYLPYEKDGYIVYFYAPKVKNLDSLKNAIHISTEEIKDWLTKTMQLHIIKKEDFYGRV